jgi:AmmeMemoRadiSam system protein B
MFYPSQAADLDHLVAGMFTRDVRRQPHAAVLVPHAGLIYSGRLAAQALERIEIPETVIVLSPKHTPYGAPWAVAPHDIWELPAREVASDPQIARDLAGAIAGMELDSEAHWREHGIEVELPFLSALAPHARVVGVVMGQASLAECKRFAQELHAFLAALGQRVLLVISSDLNHFAPEPENRRRDRIAIDAMLRLDPDALYHTVRENQVSMCGLLPAVTVLETLRLQAGLSRGELVGYTNSAEATGDTSRVVGYSSLLFD